MNHYVGVPILLLTISDVISLIVVGIVSDEREQQNNKMFMELCSKEKYSKFDCELLYKIYKGN